MEKSLCGRCKALELDAEKFIVSAPTAADTVVRGPQGYRSQQPRTGFNKLNPKSDTLQGGFATLDKT
ncbi:hypothetical protein SLS62_001018 [Diatrype stigma]|uniref:Uncharacterized protein n=1 Tax=Diatrype stigma TaxID=117547 RepID=A0AAN9V0Z9_9PEZI